MAKLIIGDWSSTCSACGGNADPNESSHISGGPQEMFMCGSALYNDNGCGATFDKPAPTITVTDITTGESEIHELIELPQGMTRLEISRYMESVEL